VTYIQCNWYVTGTPRKDPLRPLPVLSADGSREASGAQPRKRMSGQLFSRPLKPSLLSLRKLVNLDLWSMPTLNQEGSGRRRPRRHGTAYFQRTALLVPSTIMRARRQVQRVRNEKFPAVAAPPTSSVPPPGPEHHYACPETGTASTR